MKFYRELTVGFLTSALLCASAHAADDVPTYRGLVAAESQRMLTPLMIASAKSSDPVLSSRAVLAIGRTKNVAGASVLRDRVAHASDPAVRGLALFALGLLAEKTNVAGDALVGLHDRMPMVRAAAADVAARVAALSLNPRANLFQLVSRPGLIAPLERVLANDPDPAVRGRAATALGYYGKDVQARAIAAVLLSDLRNEKNADVRMHIAWSTGRAYGNVIPLAALRDGMNDGDEQVRIGMVRAAGRAGTAAIVPAVRARLNDRAWRVQEEAHESLQILAGGKRTDHLKQLQTALNVPAPGPQDTTAPLARPHALGNPRAPRSGDARLDLPLLPRTAVAFGAPLPGKHPRVRIGTTKGTIVVRLFPEWAPLTVANFLGLVDRGYFDNLRWFRIVPDFVVQTGDITDSGEGDAGYMIPAEENPLEQRSGVISMGLNYDKNGPQRDSAGTQFYITISPALHLNRDFTVFGDIESGFDTLGRLIETDRMTRVERITED